MEELYRLYKQFPAISTDTRNIIPDSIFFGIKGANFDGNQFTEQALRLGARYAVTDDKKYIGQENCIVVDNSLETLQQLALYHRRHLNIPVIGITGTNGKTTTKELLLAVLSGKYKTVATVGNLNNHIGVPLTLLTIMPDTEIAIVEMGASHPGEIAFLCDLVIPTHGIVTNIGTGHMEGFGSLSAIIETKTALYRAVINSNGTIFQNADDEILRENLHYDKVVYYSQNDHYDIHGRVISMDPYLHIEILENRITTHLTGDYNLYNFLCAAAVGDYFEINKNDLIDALSAYRPTNHRSQVVKAGTNTIIADYYNANPSSMKAALQNLGSIDFPGKAAILGDMLELGPLSLSEHRDIINLCRQLEINAYFIGDEFSKAGDGANNIFPDTAAINLYLNSHPLENSLVLVKGSRGIHLEELNILKNI